MFLSCLWGFVKVLTQGLCGPVRFSLYVLRFIFGILVFFILNSPLPFDCVYILSSHIFFNFFLSRPMIPTECLCFGTYATLWICFVMDVLVPSTNDDRSCQQLFVDLRQG